TQTLSGERPAGLRTTRAERVQAKTAPAARQGLVCPRKQTAKCGAGLVKFGGDSGALQQVSDIGGGFGRVPFTTRSRGWHGIDVKREIISAALRRGLAAAAQARVRAAGVIDGRASNAPARRVFARIFGHQRRRYLLSLDRTASAPRGWPL